MSKRILRWLGIATAVTLLVYGAFLMAIFTAMHQPVERFGRFMSYMPRPLFMVIPFEPMWNVARAGELEAGNPAPDFALQAVDAKGHVTSDGRVRLSSFRGQQPVVLIFGSYT
jgi:hypothetical protein